MNNVDEWLTNNPPSPTMAAHPSQQAGRDDDTRAHTGLKTHLNVDAAASPATPGVVDDDDDYDDDDEADLSDTSSHFSSVSEDSPPSIHAYGHTYYGSGKVMFPNDASEAHRLTLQHELLKLCLDGGLVDTKLPLEKHSPENPLQILDVGSGTGAWACDMAQRYPEVEVLGIDLTSALLPKDVPHNVTFEIADAIDPWPIKLYEFIHMRCLGGGSVNDWGALLTTAFQHLKPGGQLEFTELTPHFFAIDLEKAEAQRVEAGLSPDLGASCLEYEKAFSQNCIKLNVDFDPVPRVSEWLANSDYENIRARVDYLPLQGWGKDPVTRQKGNLLAEMIDKGISSWTNMLFGASGFDEAYTKELMERVKEEIKDPRFRSCVKVTFITARKPIDEEES